MASSKVLESGLNANQEKFCQYYVSKDSFANGVESYAAAYGIELTEKTYNSCKVLASKLLTNVNVLARINKLLDLLEQKLNDIESGMSSKVRMLNAMVLKKFNSMDMDVMLLDAH